MKLAVLKDKILSILKVRESIAGLEISDSVLRFASFDGKNWQLCGLRLPPGLIENGEIKDYAGFIEALRALRQQIFASRDRGRKINAAVSLSSVNVYSQVFSLPMIEGENLEKAIQLNVQMVSPAESSETYAGWQMVGQDQKSLRLEILSAFISRSIVDKTKKALKEAGFMIHSIESRAMSLTRLLREAAVGFDREQSYIVLSLDSSGLEFLIIRKANLYFQYFNSWRDIQGEERQISREAFEAVLVKNFHQVLSFYNSHWPEPLGGVFLSASNLQEEIGRIASKNFQLKILGLQLNISQLVNPDWFVALGSGLRNFTPHRKDQDISLLGISAQEEFRRHQLIQFVAFWRVLVPVSLSILLITFLIAHIFLARINQSLVKQSLIAMSSEQAGEIANLKKQAEEFNYLITLISKAEQSSPDKFAIADRLAGIMRQNGLTLREFYFQGGGAPVLLRGWAPSEAQILKFKKTLDADSEFQSVNLPFSEIKPSDQGLSFSISLTIAPKTP
jgi:hypothetical protein